MSSTARRLEERKRLRTSQHHRKELTDHLLVVLLLQLEHFAVKHAQRDLGLSVQCAQSSRSRLIVRRRARLCLRCRRLIDELLSAIASRWVACEVAEYRRDR